MTSEIFDEILPAVVCQNCELNHEHMGTHVLTYQAFDARGVLIEEVSLCLSCRFLWLSRLIRKNGLEVRHNDAGRMFLIEPGKTIWDILREEVGAVELPLEGLKAIIEQEERNETIPGV